MARKDQLQRFLFESAQVRGEIVHLEDSLQEVLSKRSLPAPAAHLLGESLAAVVLMSETLKYEGLLSLQARGSGPVSLLVAESTHERTIRGIAQCEDALEEGDLQQQLGEGHLVLTLEPASGKRYQGIVPLEKASLADCLGEYFERSEQLGTLFILFANSGQAAGLFLQRLPGDRTEEDDHFWEHLTVLARTLSAEELFTLDNETILHRLFHEEDIRLFPAQPVRFGCSCSEQRTGKALIALGREACYELLEEHQGNLAIDCQFCHQRYTFDRTALDHLFGNPTLH